MAAKKKPGRKAEVLKLDGDWKDAMKRAMSRGKPQASKPAAKRKKRAK